jgi:hypothetical protein
LVLSGSRTADPVSCSPDHFLLQGRKIQIVQLTREENEDSWSTENPCSFFSLSFHLQKYS